jgi:hypothetical protein
MSTLAAELATLAVLTAEHRHCDAVLGGASFQEDHGPPLDADDQRVLAEVSARRAAIGDELHAIFERCARDHASAWAAHQRVVGELLAELVHTGQADPALLATWERWRADERSVTADDRARTYAETLALVARHA